MTLLLLLQAYMSIGFGSGFTMIGIQSRIHFVFRFIVNPDPDPIIEYALRLLILWMRK